MGACTQPNNIAIVTELMQCDLHEFLRSKEGIDLSKAERIKMARGAAKGNYSLPYFFLLTGVLFIHMTLGMAWLHDICNKIHRDLKPANCMQFPLVSLL